jgi:hypothetical protein
MIQTAKLILELDQKSKYQDAQKLRGFFANTFSKVDLFHNHKETGESIYRYSKIQYRFFNNRPTVLAFGDGVELIKNFYDHFNSIKIGSYEYPIMEKHLIFEEKELAVIDDIQYYRFYTPWFALNQDNYKVYKELTTLKDREALLERILKSNILNMCKALDYYVEKKIEVQLFVKPVKSTLKDIKIITFVGDFKTNMILPNYIGLGKSVSRGFGTITQCK